MGERASKISMRQCMVCKKRAEKSSLLRFVERNGELRWDTRHRLGGRGAYFHPSLNCLTKGVDPSRLRRMLRTDGLNGEQVSSVLSSTLTEVIKRAN